MNGNRRRNRRGFAIAIGLVVLLLVTTAFASAAPPKPSYGTAVVDGDYGEWDLTKDYFADMYRAAKPTNDVLSKLYLRYDCATHTLYVLVLVEPGHPVDADIPADNHYVKLGVAKLVDGTDAPPDGTLPEFAWIALSADETTADGWEASVSLDPGMYGNLNVHTDVDDMQTSAVANREIPLTLDCITAVELASVTVRSDRAGAVPAGGIFAATLLGAALLGGGLARMRRRNP